MPGNEVGGLQLRVLVADAEPETREDLSEILARAGHTVISVATSAEARRALEREELDLLFVQIKPGRVNAMGLLAEAQRRWPRLLVVVLVDAGAGGSIEQAVQALHRGALDYLRKPVLPGVVLRVLELAEEQLSLTRAQQTPTDPLHQARELASHLGCEVLLVLPGLPAPSSAGPVSILPLFPEEPARLTRAVEDFLRDRAKGAVVLGSVEELLAHHREEEVSRILEGLRAALAGKGPLVVGYDPRRITATGALAVRASIVAADAHTTLGSLSSPIRRRVLRRLGAGPLSFSQAREAAGIEDTSKIAFHLRKLRESGLVVHLPGKRYRLTPRGRGAVKVLNLINELDPGEGSGNRTFPSSRRGPGPGKQTRTHGSPRGPPQDPSLSGTGRVTGPRAERVPQEDRRQDQDKEPQGSDDKEEHHGDQEKQESPRQAQGVVGHDPADGRQGMKHPWIPLHPPGGSGEAQGSPETAGEDPDPERRADVAPRRPPPPSRGA